MPTAYITCPPDAADELAAKLVDERLAACVNIVACRSQYRWEGDVVRDDERIILCKTSDERYDDLAERVLELHPHEVPCIERYDIAEVHEPFGAWIDAVTDGQ